MSLAISIVWACAGSSQAASDLYLPGDEDVALINDRQSGECASCSTPILATGDVNGDGYDDLAVGLAGEDASEVNVFWGGPAFVGGDFSERSHWRIRTASRVDSLVLADLNGDGRKDVAIGNARMQRLDVVFADDDPARFVDLISSTADIRALGKTSSVFGKVLAAGDFNGDGIDDLAVGDWSAGYEGRLSGGTVYLLWGSRTPSTGVIDLVATNPWPRIVGLANSALGYQLGSADLDGDGRRDLLVTSGYWDLHVFRGSAIWPEIWDLAVDAPNRSLTRGPNIYLQSSADLTGDGLDEVILISASSVNSGGGVWMIPNALLTATGSVSYSTGLLSRIIPAIPWNSSMFVLAGDTDGDGWNDLLVSNDWAATLSSDAGGALGALPAREPSLRFWGDLSVMNGMGDLNGDGKDDFIHYVSHRTPASPGFGEVDIVYGYRPVRNPTVTVADRPASRRADLTLSATGGPAEMLLTGDIVDDFKDRWIPYAPTSVVSWTSGEGVKTVRARFRTAGGRVSEWAQATGNLAVETAGLVTVTNRLKGTGRIELDCRVTERTRVRAWVYDGEGNELDRLMDEEAEAGIVTVRWDGTNRNGRRVAPGWYVVAVEWAGRRERKNVVVE